MKRHADTVMRVCTVYFANQADRDDAFQDTFVKYAQSGNEFDGDEHRKAWLIRVAANTCKDMLKAAHTRNTALDDVDEGALVDETASSAAERSLEAQRLTEAMRALDEKYRTVLYLKYYEGYTAPEIAKTLGMPENTVYTNLARGKEKLKEVLADE